MSIFTSTKKLGFGLMRLPLIPGGAETEIDIEHLKKMVDHFMEQGFTYFDTAWMYHGLQSEKAIKKALVERYPRDSYTLTTKFHVGFCESKDKMEDFFNTQLSNTGVEYFDYYLIHDIERGNYSKYQDYDAFNWALKKKEMGLIKHLGFSFHSDAEMLDKVLTEHPYMEFVQLQINYLDWESENVQSRRCYEVARKHNTPIIVMEPVKGGTLVNVPENVQTMFKNREPEMSIPSWAIRFVASLPGIEMVLSGMSNMDQMIDNVSYMKEFKSLTEDEINICVTAGKMISGDIKIPCTGCSYCTEGCPLRIPIPKLFALYNQDGTDYDAAVGEGGKASMCVECGQCEGICPQHLEVITYLKTVAEKYED